jgi:hypothetical protein
LHVGPGAFVKGAPRRRDSGVSIYDTGQWVVAYRNVMRRALTPVASSTRGLNPLTIDKHVITIGFGWRCQHMPYLLF